MSKKERITKQAERFAKDKISRGDSDKVREGKVRGSVKRATEVVNLTDKLKALLIGIFILAVLIGGAIIGIRSFMKSICPHWIYDSDSVMYSYKYEKVSFKCLMCGEYTSVSCPKEDIEVTIIKEPTCFEEGVQKEVYHPPATVRE